jgi:hypothetical protein
MSTMISVSTISIVVMERVSDAKARGTTRRGASPARSSGRLVRV